MKLKVVISAGLLLGLSVISTVAFAQSFADDMVISSEDTHKSTILETKRPLKELAITPVLRIPMVPQEETTETESRWSDEDAYLLAKIGMAEAGNQDIDGIALVMCVVLNRVSSEAFPETIEEVIFEQNKGVYQFAPIGDGRWEQTEPNQNCWDALQKVEDGWDASQGALYFESSGESTWHKNNLKFLFKHGAHNFYTNK